MVGSNLSAVLCPIGVLIRLVEAVEQATALERDAWQFAVPLSELSAQGATINDLRYLHSRGWIEARSETTKGKRRARSFRHGTESIPHPRPAFVVTQEGLKVAASIHRLVVNGAAPAPASESMAAEIPRWDESAGDLWYLGRLVKRLSHRAKGYGQWLLYAAFEEDHWNRHIDDPLPPKADVDPKARLNNLIKKLNSNQINQLLEFHGDGTGEGLCWEPFDERHHNRTRPAPRRP